MKQVKLQDPTQPQRSTTVDKNTLTGNYTLRFVLDECGNIGARILTSEGAITLAYSILREEGITTVPDEAPQEYDVYTRNSTGEEISIDRVTDNRVSYIEAADGDVHSRNRSDFHRNYTKKG